MIISIFSTVHVLPNRDLAPIPAQARPQASASEVDINLSRVQHVATTVDLLRDERCVPDVRQRRPTNTPGSGPRMPRQVVSNDNVPYPSSSKMAGTLTEAVHGSGVVRLVELQGAEVAAVGQVPEAELEV